METDDAPEPPSTDGTPDAAAGPTRDGRRTVRWRSGTAAPMAVGVALGILGAQSISAVIGRLQGLITVAITSLFLSFAMEPAVQYLARRGMRRGAATGIVFVVGFLLLGGFMAAMTGLVLDQLRSLAASAPRLLSDLADQATVLLPGDTGTNVAAWLDEQQRQLPGRISAAAGALGRGALGFGQTILGGVFQLATIGLVTFYLVADAPRLRSTLASRLEPRDQVRVLGVWELAIAKTGGYVYSRALTAVVSAVFHSVVFMLLGLDYAIALGVWVGLISSLIPAVGTYLAGALPIIIALAERPSLALWVLTVIVIYQQIENYLLVPRITASTLELHPAIAFLSVLAGGAVAGAVGALLAIPAVAIVTALLSAATEEYDVLEHHLLETGPSRAAALVADSELAARITAPGPITGRRRTDRVRGGTGAGGDPGSDHVGGPERGTGSGAVPNPDDPPDDPDRPRA